MVGHHKDGIVIIIIIYLMFIIIILQLTYLTRLHNYNFLISLLILKQ